MPSYHYPHNILKPCWLWASKTSISNFSRMSPYPPPLRHYLHTEVHVWLRSSNAHMFHIFWRIIGLALATLAFGFGLLADIFLSPQLFLIKNACAVTSGPLEVLISLLYWGISSVSQQIFFFLFSGLLSANFREPYILGYELGLRLPIPSSLSGVQRTCALLEPLNWVFSPKFDVFVRFRLIWLLLCHRVWGNLNCMLVRLTWFILPTAAATGENKIKLFLGCFNLGSL